jgi:hypothetical protein
VSELKSYTYACTVCQLECRYYLLALPSIYPLIGSFFLGFTFCDCRERNSDRNIIFRCSFNGYFFLGYFYFCLG